MQEKIENLHKGAAEQAMQKLHQGAFGRIGERLDGKLQAALDRNLQDTLNKNEIQSSRACESLESSVSPPFHVYSLPIYKPKHPYTHVFM